LTVNEFSIFLQNLGNHGNDKLLEITERLKVKSQEEIYDFALALFDARKFVTNFGVYVRLAQTIELEISLTHPEKSFKSALMKIVEDVFLSLPSFESILAAFKKNQTRAVLSMAGELFIIDWIGEEEIFELFGKFFVEDFNGGEKLRCLSKLLQTVSVKMMKNNCGGQFEDISRRLGEAKGSLIDIEEQLACDEVLEMIEMVQKFSSGEIKAEKVESSQSSLKQSEDLLKNLNQRNFRNASRKLSAINFSNEAETMEFIRMFIKSMVDSDQPEEKFAKLAFKMDNESFREFLTNELQHILLDSFAGSSIKVDENLKITAFIGELYNLEVIDDSTINLVLEVLFGNEKSSNEAVNCIDILIRTAGVALDERNKARMDRYFAFMNFVVESQDGTTHKAKIYQKLLQNRQKKVGEERDIEAIWQKIVDDHEEIENYAQLCSEMSTRSKSGFGGKLTEFIQQQPIDDNINKLLFIAELYKHGLVADKVLNSWIKPFNIEELPSEIVTRLINSISPRANADSNVAMLALLMMLEELVEDESEKACAALKEELLELAAIIARENRQTA
jgi:hypothetical protein